MYRARTIFPLVIPVDGEVLDRTNALLDRQPDLSARDGLHAAVVLVHELEGIVSFDRDFDRLDEVRRFEPQR